MKRQPRDAYRFFLLDPQHPGLHFKRVGKWRPVYSVRVSRNNRAWLELTAAAYNLVRLARLEPVAV